MVKRVVYPTFGVLRAKIVYLTKLAAHAVRSLRFRDVVTGAGALALVFLAAEKAIEGPLVMPSPDPVLEREDPTLVAVGTTPIRLSDARAQAGVSPVRRPDSLPTLALFETGLVDEAADQVALAKLAEQEGLDKSLEVRAQLALARRRILSSALLDLAVSRQLSDEEIRAAYDAEVAAAAGDEILHLRRILVSSEEEAIDIAKRIEDGVSFADMARRRSLDAESRNVGGEMEPWRLSELPVDIAAAVRDLPVGATSAPIKGEEGWYLVTVDVRRALRLPGYDEMRVALERRLRDDIVARTIAEARAAVPIRLAGSSLDAAPTPQLMLLGGDVRENW